MRGRKKIHLQILFVNLSLLVLLNTPLTVLTSEAYDPINDDLALSWYDNDWKYRWTISFTWMLTQIIYDYQALVILPRDFDYDLLATSGNDIRFKFMLNYSHSNAPFFHA